MTEVMSRALAILLALSAAWLAPLPSVAQDLLEARLLEQRVGPAVVFIRAHQGGGASTEGSGVVISRNGWVITNQHVLADSRDVEVWVPVGAGFTRYPAVVAEADARRDLALLRIDGEELVAAELGGAEDLRPGTAVASLGYPEGLFASGRQMRIVPGVVSHTRFPLGELEQRFWVVSDVRLREGNSGGPLVDARGRVVGINTIRRLDGETSLSIPIDEVYLVLADLTGLRQRLTRELATEIERLRRDLGWSRRVLARAPAGLGEVSGRLVRGQVADAERLLTEAGTSFMTGRWAQSRTQLAGARRAVRWVRAVLGLGMTSE